MPRWSPPFRRYHPGVRQMLSISFAAEGDSITYVCESVEVFGESLNYKAVR